ncbi:glycosyltransferase [Candidatus Peregrinibacteria bacterium CG10_big_fil_rev_8_21_14_0_10_49_24]|nr:MAG: glycosyltransferase [Candidatus Peregrinibacteria bacterium CG11_big_fil_rev_8_21_14_0_20_49_14]PIR50920.1 MAG: glycosyltransferase [Candidatus Peregrinibacteria bacterium CG10_big_fil_rev_8_21_14_0_10_49_24]PJA67345.1 MAG: glycosyltransferase [Candidatus Peregrinibacteria bacterium CG_4_9_14_3_um_filter_49_12]
MPAPTLSIVIPAYNEAENLPALYDKFASQYRGRDDIEFLFVDDASTDTTITVLHDLVQKDDRVRAWNIRQNSAKGGALAVGFSNARGKYIVTMDADLQDDPSEIPRLLSVLENGADAVIGWKKERKDSLQRRMTSRFFNGICNMCFGHSFRDMNSGLKAFRNIAVHDLPLYGGLFRFIPHVLRFRGYTVVEIPVLHHTRHAGKSKFGLKSRCTGLLDLLTITFLLKYQKRPFHLFGTVGILLFLGGLLCGLYLSGIWIQGTAIGGRPLLLLSVLLMVLGGQFISLGWLGELIVLHKNGGNLPLYEEITHDTETAG